MTAYQPVTNGVQTASPTRVTNRPCRLFLLIAPLLYAAYALLTPPFQNFDENQHLYRAWQISSGQLTAQRRGNRSGGELPPGLATATIHEIGSAVPQGHPSVLRRPFSEIFAQSTPIGTHRKLIYYDFFGSALYSPAGYLPQVAAVLTGEAGGLSVEWTLRLGRLLNVALCISLVACALSVIPYGRWPMAIVALSPPMAAGAASFGQDGLVNSAGLVLTALGLKVAADRRWTSGRALAVGVAGGAITLAKFVYLPLVAVAAFPLPRDITVRRWLLPPLLIGALAAALLYGWMRINADAVLDPLSPRLPSFREQVTWAAVHPIDFALLIGRTWLVWLLSLWARIYAFGDSTVPVVWIAAVPGTAALVAILAYGEPDAMDLTRSRRFWMLLIFAAVALLITTAMFILSSPRGAVVIGGIQGRYFLAILPLGAIALMRRGENAPSSVLTAAIVLVLLANIATLGTIAWTFYSF